MGWSLKIYLELKEIHPPLKYALAQIAKKPNDNFTKSNRFAGINPPIARLSLHDLSFCASRQKQFFRLRHALRLSYIDEAVALLFVPYNTVSGSEGKIHVRK